MPLLDAPPIDPRQAKDMLLEMIRRIPAQFPAWKSAIPTSDEDALRMADDARDFGMALLKLAARMGEVVSGQINRVPEKNFLAFLDFLGMDRQPPKAARAPLTFMLSKNAPTDRRVPKGTQVGAAGRDDVIFETEVDLVVTRAILAGAYSLDLVKDRYIDLAGLISSPSAEGLEIFNDSGMSSDWLPNEHTLYLGHDTLFSQASEAGAELDIAFTLESGAGMPDLVWEYSTAEGWKPAAATSGSPSTA